MDYPKNIKKQYKKTVNYANRGMDLENLINITNEKYLDQDIAVIYKKPTPIQVVNYDYNSKKIKEAFFDSPSTLDYNGVYKGYYIEFDAKNTNKNNLPLQNIAHHQLLHINKVINHGGICFLIIMINEEAYLLKGEDLIAFINNEDRKSIPYEYINERGIKLEYNYLKGIDYIKAIDIIIREMEHEKA